MLKDRKDFDHMLDDYIKLFDENVAVLNDIEYLLQSEKENMIVTGLTKNDLVDMAYEVSDSSRIKRTESNFVRRLLEKKSD
jgi:hypothetical protein